MLGKNEGGEGGNRGWDGWMASKTQWTWIWANSGRWWRTGKPGLQRVGYIQLSDWKTSFLKVESWPEDQSKFSGRLLRFHATLVIYCFRLSMCPSFWILLSQLLWEASAHSRHHLWQVTDPSCWAGLEETHQTNLPGSCPGSWKTNQAYTQDLGSDYQARNRITESQDQDGGAKRTWQIGSEISERN